MERHEIDAELNTPGAQELLAGTSAAHLAYVGSDATPRVIPVGFWWTGEEFVISTATTSPKVAALSARPHVALAIDTGGSPGAARALSVRGRADVESVDGVVEEYVMAARKNMDTEAAAAFEGMRAMGHSPFAPGVFRALYVLPLVSRGSGSAGAPWGTSGSRCLLIVERSADSSATLTCSVPAVGMTSCVGRRCSLCGRCEFMMMNGSWYRATVAGEFQGLDDPATQRWRRCRWARTRPTCDPVAA